MNVKTREKSIHEELIPRKLLSPKCSGKDDNNNYLGFTFPIIVGGRRGGGEIS